MKLAGYEILGSSFDFFSDGIIIVSLDKTVTYINNSAATLIGMHPKEILHQGVEKLSQDLYEIIKQQPAVNRTIARFQALSLSFNCRNGHFKRLAYVSELGENPVCGYLIVLKNEGLKNDAGFLKKHAGFIKVLSSKPDEYCYISDLRNGNNIFCSESVQHFLGWESNNFVKGTWAFAISQTHPGDVNQISQYYQERSKWYDHPYQYDHLPIVYEYRFLHKAGYYVDVNTKVMVLERDKDDKPLFTINFGKTAPSIPTKKIQKIEQFPANSFDYLTNREKQVLLLFSKGMSYKMVAAELEISLDSVRTYVRRMYVKLDVHSVTEAIHKVFCI